MNSKFQNHDEQNCLNIKTFSSKENIYSRLFKLFESTEKSLIKNFLEIKIKK